MGHLDTPKTVITDKAFYQDLPVKLLKSGKPKFKFEMEMSSSGDLKVSLEMLQLKLWLRLQVFIELSQYLTQALGRLKKKEAKAVTPQKAEVI